MEKSSFGLDASPERCIKERKYNPYEQCLNKFRSHKKSNSDLVYKGKASLQFMIA